MTAVEQIVDLW